MTIGLLVFFIVCNWVTYAIPISEENLIDNINEINEDQYSTEADLEGSYEVHDGSTWWKVVVIKMFCSWGGHHTKTRINQMVKSELWAEPEEVADETREIPEDHRIEPSIDKALLLAPKEIEAAIESEERVHLRGSREEINQEPDSPKLYRSLRARLRGVKPTESTTTVKPTETNFHSTLETLQAPTLGSFDSSDDMPEPFITPRPSVNFSHRPITVDEDRIIGTPKRSCPEGQNEDQAGRCRQYLPYYFRR